MTEQTVSAKTEGAKVIFARPNADQVDLRRRWIIEQGEVESIDKPIGYVDVKTVRPSRNGMHTVTAHYRIHFSQVITYLWEATGAADAAETAPTA